jgi:hypothetical protein
MTRGLPLQDRLRRGILTHGVILSLRRIVEEPACARASARCADHDPSLRSG